MQPSAVGTARDYTNPVTKHQRVFSVRVRLGSRNVVDVHNDRPIDAHKPLGIELLLERFHGIPDKVGLSERVEADVVALSIDPIDFVGPDEIETLMTPDEKALRI